MSINFSLEGHVRHWPTAVVVGIAALGATATPPYGMFTYKSNEVIAWVLPIAGTLVALALPAAQLAQAVLESFLSSAEKLLRTAQPVPQVREYLSKVAKQYRRDLQSTRCVVIYSLISFLIAIAGALGLFSTWRIRPWFAFPDLLASLSVALLVAAVLWFVPVVKSAFSFEKGDELLTLLAAAPGRVEVKAAAPATPAGAAAAVKAEPVKAQPTQG